ncbi:hypothetical protein DUNSADRAFT_4764, partial [Dunaliella salina]
PPLQPRPPPSEPPRVGSGRRRFHGTVFETPSGRWRSPSAGSERPSSTSGAQDQGAQSGVEQSGVAQNGVDHSRVAEDGHGPPEQQVGGAEDGPQGHSEGGEGDRREEEGEEGEAGGPVFIEHRRSSAQPVIFGNGLLEEEQSIKIVGTPPAEDLDDNEPAEPTGTAPSADTL